jgi:hypothetical protein
MAEYSLILKYYYLYITNTILFCRFYLDETLSDALGRSEDDW